MLALAAAYDRCQQRQLRLLRILHQLIRHFIHALPFDRFTAVRTVRCSDSGIQQTKIVIDFRYRSDRGTRIPVCRFLVNGDRRRQSLDGINIRFFHLPEELAGVRRQRLHVAPLSFRINGVKSQRRLPGTGKSCENNKFISRNINADILQVMLPCTANFNVIDFLMLSHIFPS